MKEIITEAQFRRSIKTPDPAYIFFGDEDYLKGNALSVAKSELISPEAEAFDYVRIGQADFSPEALAAALASPPMLGEYKLVTLSIAFTDLRAAEISAICEILGSLEEDSGNVVIISIPQGGIDVGTPKKMSPGLRKLCEQAQGVRFDRVTPGRLGGWAARHFAENGVQASADICAAVVDFCGTDMFTLASEIDKISYLVLARSRKSVMEEDIREAACSNEEFDSFALANAILERNTAAALAVLSKMKAEKAEPVRIMAELIRVICELNTVAVSQASGMNQNEMIAATGIKAYPLSKDIAALRRIDGATLKHALELCVAADAQTKGYGKGYVPIEQLICSI
ncbi:MAG: DNA polymerase III subunit delta [Eubacteriales bacterium]